MNWLSAKHYLKMETMVGGAVEIFVTLNMVLSFVSFTLEPLRCTASVIEPIFLPTLSADLIRLEQMVSSIPFFT